MPLAHLTPITGQPEVSQLQAGSDGNPGPIPLGFSWLCDAWSISLVLKLAARETPSLHPARESIFSRIVARGRKLDPPNPNSPKSPPPWTSQVEEDEIAMIDLITPPLGLISLPQNKVDLLESPHVHHTSIPRLEWRLNLMSTKHLVHKAGNKSQLLLILLQGFCPSQRNNVLLLILISSLSIPKKDLRLLLLFVGTTWMAPIHLLLPMPTADALVSFIQFLVQHTFNELVSTLCQTSCKTSEFRNKNDSGKSFTAPWWKQPRVVTAQCKRCYNRGVYKPSSYAGGVTGRRNKNGNFSAGSYRMKRSSLDCCSIPTLPPPSCLLLCQDSFHCKWQSWDSALWKKGTIWRESPKGLYGFQIWLDCESEVISQNSVSLLSWFSFLDWRSPQWALHTLALSPPRLKPGRDESMPLLLPLMCQKNNPGFHWLTPEPITATRGNTMLWLAGPWSHAPPWAPQ